MRTWLRNVRLANDLLQKDVSRACAISAGSYCMIENGERRPSVETAKK